MPLTILSPGPLTTVQDEGRFGHLHAGIEMCIRDRLSTRA